MASKYLSPFEFSDIYRDLRSSWVVLKNDILEFFYSLANKIGAWFLRVFTLSVSHYAIADCQSFIIRVITPYSLCCDVAAGWTSKELCFDYRQ
jgi:hypothetical protein